MRIKSNSSLTGFQKIFQTCLSGHSRNELNFGTGKLNSCRNDEYPFTNRIVNELFCGNIMQERIVDALRKFLFIDSDSARTVTLRIKVDNQNLTSLLSNAAARFTVVVDFPTPPF